MHRKLSNLVAIFTFHFFLWSWSGPEDFSFSKFMTTLVIHSRLGLKFWTVLQFLVLDYRLRVTVLESSSFAFLLFSFFFFFILRLIINNRLLYVKSDHLELFFIVFEAFFPYKNLVLNCFSLRLVKSWQPSLYHFVQYLAPFKAFRAL